MDGITREQLSTSITEPQKEILALVDKHAPNVFLTNRNRLALVKAIHELLREKSVAVKHCPKCGRDPESTPNRWKTVCYECWESRAENMARRGQVDDVVLPWKTK